MTDTVTVTGEGVSAVRAMAIYRAVGLEIVGLRTRGRSATSLAKDLLKANGIKPKRKRVDVQNQMAGLILDQYSVDVTRKRTRRSL